MFKEISLDVKTFDMRYHATMAKNRGVSCRHKEGKETIKHFALMHSVFIVFLVFFTK